jgi:hypothetical protein
MSLTHFQNYATDMAEDIQPQSCGDASSGAEVSFLKLFSYVAKTRLRG